MTQPDLPDAVGDAEDETSASASAITPLEEADAAVAGGLRSSRERSGPRALPEQFSARVSWQRDLGRGRWPDDGPAEEDGGPSPRRVSHGLKPSHEWEGEEHTSRQLHPLPRGLVELYGLLAVLFVLVPEWMASGALLGFQESREGSRLPPPSGAWKRLPELRLASLNLAELRQLAHERRLIGYGRQRRQQLTTRLLRSLKARP